MAAAFTHFRYERKFLPDGLTLPEVVALVRYHPALFHEPYPERMVNNLYFDTPDLRHYQHHINGAANRLKIRLRWYGDFRGRVEQPALELKIRHGLVCRKEAYAMPALDIDGDFSRSKLEARFQRDGLPEAARLHLHCLEPSLANRYRRRYFCSADGALRLTLDWELRFAAPRNFHGASPALFHCGPPVVVELKYGDTHAEHAARAASVFPFRLTRCSKYVLGLQHVNGG